MADRLMQSGPPSPRERRIAILALIVGSTLGIAVGFAAWWLQHHIGVTG